MSVAHANNRQIHQTESGLVAEETNIIVHNPFPTSTEMRKYSEIDKSYPERLIAYAEREQENRYALANRGMNYGLIKSVLGYASSSGVVGGICYFCFYLVEKGMTGSAVSVIIMSIGSIAGVFLKYPPRRR